MEKAIMRSEENIVKERNKFLNKKLKQLLKQKKILSATNERLLERALKLDSQLQETKDRYLKINGNANSDTEKLVHQLDNFNEHFSQIIDILGNPSSQDVALFPSRAPLNDYFQSEEEFTSTLTNYTKRQFFEGIADMAGSKDKLRYEILEVSKPESFLIRGETDEALEAKCKELKRLQSVYSSNQAIKVKSLCNLRRIQACLYRTEDVMSKISSEPVWLDTDKLSSRIIALQRKCEDRNRELSKIFDETLIPLIEEMGELQTAKILSGNFDLKISRQDYFISKQDAVIDELLLQNSRYEFLSMLYEMEAKSHRESYHLLSTANNILGSDENAIERRIAFMQEHLEEKPVRETIDSRDSFMQNIFKMLDPEANAAEIRPFITYAMLQENFDNFTSEAKEKIHTPDRDKNSEMGVLDDMKKQLDECTMLLLGKNVSKESQATQEDINEKISKINDVLKTIEKSVKSAISEVDGKKKILAADSLKALERTLFTSFFNDPRRLKRIVTELRTRVEALSR